MHLTNLGAIEEGKTFLLPVRVQSSQPVIEGTDIVYIVLNKPVRILTVGKIYSTHIKVPVTSQPVKSLTYEALIYIDQWGWNGNMTIMGREGTLSCVSVIPVAVLIEICSRLQVLSTSIHSSVLLLASGIM